MFYKKFRPTTLNELAGNAITIKAIKAALAPGSGVRQFLLTGPSGGGKTTAARIIAGIFLGVPVTEVLTHIDYEEVCMSTNGGIQKVRSVKLRQNYRPMGGKYHVYIFDECDVLSKEADKAFLKTIENSEDFVVHIFIATKENSLSEELTNRCVHYHMQALNEAEIVSVLQVVLKKAGKNADLRILREIARQTDGIPRKAVNQLEQIISLPLCDQVDFLVNNKTFLNPAADPINGKGVKPKSK